MLIILSMTFIAAVVGDSAAKGLISGALGLLAAYIETGQDFTPRLTMGADSLSDGFPIVGPVLGVLIVGQVFKAIEDMWQERRGGAKTGSNVEQKLGILARATIKRIFPYIMRSAFVGTTIGALSGIGSTLAATLGYSSGKLHHDQKKSDSDTAFGEGAPEGIAATEAANSSVSGANLIPVLSLGIPGNAAAVFLILAVDSIGGFNLGPSVFRFSSDSVNPELVIAFGLFTMMMMVNLLNWSIGGFFIRLMGIMARLPKHQLLPVVLLLTLTSIYNPGNQYGDHLGDAGLRSAGLLDAPHCHVAPAFHHCLHSGRSSGRYCAPCLFGDRLRPLVPVQFGHFNQFSHGRRSGSDHRFLERKVCVTRPNIILISGDQHRADCFGFEGRKVKTPHLDQLAKDGTVFSNCITPCVVCQPARGSILTGQLPQTHGLHDNGMDLDPAIGDKGIWRLHGSRRL